MGLAHQGPGVFFLFVAFVLLILASVSAPIAHFFYFLRADYDTTVLRFGAWGTCTKIAQGGYDCSPKHLGYNASIIPNLDATKIGDISNTITHGLTYALVLHPVAAGIALLAIIVSLTTHVVLDICGSLIAGLAFLVTLAAFIVDSILFIDVRHRINKADTGTQNPAKLGNAYWMVMVAMICLLIATFTVCFGSVSARRAKRNSRMSSTPARRTRCISSRPAGSGSAIKIRHTIDYTIHARCRLRHRQTYLFRYLQCDVPS